MKIKRYRRKVKGRSKWKNRDDTVDAVIVVSVFEPLKPPTLKLASVVILDMHLLIFKVIVSES